MLSQEQNDLITRIGPGTAAGGLMRRYWQPVALVDELPAQPAGQAGQADGREPRAVPRRHGPLRTDGARLSASRHRSGLRTAGERRPALRLPRLAVRHRRPMPGDAGRAGRLHLCANIRQKAYPVVEKSGILFAYMGPGEPPAFPHFDCFVAPASHTFAFKGMIDCNWLQSLEVGIDPAHTSFLHRFFHDEDPKQGYGKLFRDTSIDSEMPMTRIMREFPRPRIEVEPTDFGMRIVTLRRISDASSPRPRHQPDVPERLHHSDEPAR